MTDASTRLEDRCARHAVRGPGRTISDGSVSAVLDGDFPRYAWKRVDDRVYEARLSNAGLGQYKGYPIKDHEAPGWLK